MENNLASIRYSKRISLSELAKKSGISKSHINKIENDQRDPTVPTAYAICKALDSTIYDVFPDSCD